MTKAVFTQEQILKVAKLVKLNLTKEQTEKLAGMFGETLDYIKILEELDTSTTAETYQVTGLTDVFAKDNKNTLSQEEALSNAPKKSKGHFVTDGVFDR
jgi:aspartyl/glutamyl-tRNA(Asn/Gln) amidotransferase C subunit